MIEKEGMDGMSQTHWKLYVPDEHCKPGLEVGIIAGAGGMMIGGQVINGKSLKQQSFVPKGTKYNVKTLGQASNASAVPAKRQE